MPLWLGLLFGISMLSWTGIVNGHLFKWLLG